jgi:cation diffusion facilitator family transporter
MEPQDSSHCHSDQAFDSGNPVGERGTRAVIVLSFVMMIVELVAGFVFGSMALLADGWHMATHVAAMGIAAGAYFFARYYARDTRFAFGTWKIEVLGGFTSAVVLGLVAVGMIMESVQRLWNPLAISYRESLLVAVVGLMVNLLSVWFLHDSPDERGEAGFAERDSHGGEGHHHHHHDVNLRAAFMHVIADAITSILAIVALAGGWWLGWHGLDPVMGVVGGVIIGWWSLGLAGGTGRILLDCEMDHPIVREVRELAVANPGIEIRDLHVWRVGRRKYACIVSIVVSDLRESQEFRRALGNHPELGHITIEVFGRPEAAARQIVETHGDH